MQTKNLDLWVLRKCLLLYHWESWSLTSASIAIKLKRHLTSPIQAIVCIMLLSKPQRQQGTSSIIRLLSEGLIQLIILSRIHLNQGSLQIVGLQARLFLSTNLAKDPELILVSKLTSKGTWEKLKYLLKRVNLRESSPSTEKYLQKVCNPK